MLKLAQRALQINVVTAAPVATDSTAKGHVPYVPASSTLPELTVKAVVLGVLMAVVLGAANAYLGLKAGLTVSATFPAAVVAIAAFRLPFFRGSILEQNLARTAASVGEALVAGAIGFVGLVVPHLLRGAVGGRPSDLLWASALGGAVLVLAADISVRLVWPDRDIKLGVLMALIGAPLFLHLIYKTRREIL